nr:PAS domain S-box protein [Rhizobium sp. RCAM05973]
MAERAANQLVAIVESSHDAIVSKDLSGIITSWNDSAERLFGYPPEEAIGKPITMIIPPDRLDEEPLILGRIRRGERVDHFETVRQRKDGTLVEISLTISPIRDDHGRVVGASKIARDITDRKAAEAKLRRNEQQMKDLLAAIPAAIYTTDANGKITYYNEAAVELAGRIPIIGSDEWCVSSKLYWPDGTPLPHDQCPMAIALKEGRIVRGWRPSRKGRMGRVYLSSLTPRHCATKRAPSSVGSICWSTSANEKMRRHRYACCSTS